MSKTILIVDDDKGVQRLLADALAAEGFSVIVEKDGEWALKTFETKSVDAVILDLLIPAMNGFQVAERIRELPKGKNVPLILISGIYKSQTHHAEAKKKYGVLEYLDKPMNLGKLTEALRKAFGEEYPRPDAGDEHRERIDRKAPEKFADAEAKEEVTDVERAAKQGFRTAQMTKGSFTQKPFPEVLAELFRWRASGALLLRRDKVKKIVYFRDGRPIFIKSNLLSECLGKIMVREKMISETECEESLRRMKASGRQQGTVLIEMGCISPHNLVYALELQLQTKLYDIFAWDEGDYQFNPKAEVPSSPNALEQTAASIIYEGVTRSYSATRVLKALGNVEEQYVHPAADPLYRFQDAGLDPEELALFQEIDGRKTVAQVVTKATLPRERAYAFLYAMKCAQMVTMRDGRARSEQPPPRPPTGKVAIGPPPLTTNPSLRTTPPPRPGRSATPPPFEAALASVPSDDREVREKLAAQVAAMKKMTYFEILGLPKNAGSAEVKRAYFQLAKEYHPDKHFASASAEVKSFAGEIFAMLQTAADVLGDNEERQRYLAELAKGGAKKDVSDEVSRILAAEGKFQRGEELLRKKYYKEAVEAFREAVGLYAEEGEFHAYLGWSLYQTDTKNEVVIQEALDHIEKAIRLNPKVDKSYLFLGYIYKGTGRPDKAEKQFEKAIQCNPDCTEALRELRLLGRSKARA